MYLRQETDAVRHREPHRIHRAGWLRAAVLGANDGIVSTASLILGVAAAGASSQSIVVAGVAGLVAGAMSMAAGEYISVSSQADTERADLDREQTELAADPEREHAEMTAMYVARGVDQVLQRASPVTRSWPGGYASGRRTGLRSLPRRVTVRKPSPVSRTHAASM